MGILDIPPELLLLVVGDLSIGDLLAFRLTCCRVRDVLKQHFQKVCLQDVGQLTAIQRAAVHGYDELIELAISNAATIDTPLKDNLKWIRVREAKSVNRVKIWDILDWANKSAETKAKHSIIRTPLFLAACFGQVKVIELLLKKRASMQCFGQMMTPAHVSATRGDVDCLRAFIQAGFNINTRGTKDQTILHVATLSGIKMMKYILQLEGGANLVNARDSEGFTPLSYLATTYDKPYHDRHMRKMVEVLVQHKADIHARDKSGDMAAHHFAWMGSVGCLRPLIDAGFDLHSKGEHGATILHRAVVGGKKTIEYLVGLDGGKLIIDIKNDDGKTPLEYASGLMNKWPVREVLMRHGATSTTRRR